MANRTLKNAWPVAGVLAGLFAAACQHGTRETPTAVNPNDAGGGGEEAGLNPYATFEAGAPASALASISIEPGGDALEVSETGGTRTFVAMGHFVDGSKAPLGMEVSWLASEPVIGTIAAGGVFTASGKRGGVVSLHASARGLAGDTTLTVKLKTILNSDGVADPLAASLRGAKDPDPTATWAYPYDGTVFPRGLGAPDLMWKGGASGDAYYLHITSATYEFEGFYSLKPERINDDVWEAFVNSTSGPAEVTVAHVTGTTAQVLGALKWRIAPASMRGTIYYWANDKGRILRIKPGSTTPDDFSAPEFMNNGGGCTMTCHNVSADGSTLVSGGGSFAGSYDLLQNKKAYASGSWAFAALSPDGKYVVPNSGGFFSPGPGGTGNGGIYRTADGTLVDDSGLTTATSYPAFAPNGSRLVYTEASGGLRAYDFDPTTVKFSNDRQIVAGNIGNPIVWPSVSPDGNWVMYTRGQSMTTGTKAALFLASATTPDLEVRLAATSGDTYPFAAGDRDRELNFEPTFAPVAAGGFFWVVFTSRRTYGTQAQGGPESVKQLWVAAVDLPINEQDYGKTDPSHPAFRLPGQNLTSLNMRGFWASDPCKQEGNGCAEGIECCGGSCVDDGKGIMVCGTKAVGGCSKNGSRCETVADCCDQTSFCINKVCSEAPPPK